MINLSAVRATGSRPRVHGNGFIQLDLTDRSRLHIWGDERIPRQKVATPIHDHVFGFESTVIIGRVVNVVYDVEPTPHGDYRVYYPAMREGHDTALEPSHLTVLAQADRVDMVSWNSRFRKYTIRVREVHETFAPDGPAATIIIKDDVTQAQGALVPPRVLVPIFTQPDNEFDRHSFDEDLLWRITEDTLKRRTH